MQFAVRWIDLTENLQSGRQPQLMLERPLLHGNDKRGGVFANAEVARKGEFWTPQSAMISTDPAFEVEWSKTKAGQYVRVPLHAYRTPSRALSWILAIGTEIGMRAIDSLKDRVRKPLGQVVLALGNECTDLSPTADAFRCYIGISIQLEE